MLTYHLSTILVQKTRDLISSLDFMNRHKTNSQAFTRKRFFKFEIVCVMLLQKTLKSIQLHLHALTHQLELLGGKTEIAPKIGDPLYLGYNLDSFDLLMSNPMAAPAGAAIGLAVFSWAH